MSQDVAVSATASQLESVKLEDNTPLPFGKETRKQFQFADNFVNLNHGKFIILIPIFLCFLGFRSFSLVGPALFIIYLTDNNIDCH